MSTKTDFKRDPYTVLSDTHKVDVMLLTSRGMIVDLSRSLHKVSDVDSSS